MGTILLIIVTYFLIGLLMYYIAFAVKKDALDGSKFIVNNCIGQNEWFDKFYNETYKILLSNKMLYAYIFTWPIEVYKSIMININTYKN